MDQTPEQMTARQIELETKVGFLEHTIDDLNEVILDQGRAIDRLERRVAGLETRASATGGGDEEGTDLVSERPPHY